MPSVLQNVLRFTGLAIGVPTAQAHGINLNGRAVRPYRVWGNANGIDIAVDDTNVTVTRTAAGGSAIDVCVELLHSIIDAEPLPNGVATSVLPFIANGGGATGAGAVAIAAGTQTAGSGIVLFNNSGGISFGMSASTQVTASMDAIRSVIAPGSTGTGPTISFANGNGVTFGMIGMTITASAQTAGGTATGVGISAGTEVATTGAVIFSNSNQISFGLNAQTVTATFAAVKTISADGGSVTNGQLSFVNSNSISFGINAGSITAIANLPSVQRVVVYSATGGESDFSVTMTPVANTNYAVMAQCAGVASVVGFDLPRGTANRALTAFRVIPTAVLVSNDVIEFALYAS